MQTSYFNYLSGVILLKLLKNPTFYSDLYAASKDCDWFSKKQKKKK